jgi:sigma-B regulation protein RsbQ
MVGPSPCYINDEDYVGGFSREDIDSLLETLESNYLGWASSMAPVIMGVPDQPELGRRSSQQLLPHRSRDRQAVRPCHLLSDHRAELPRLQSPTLILQCSRRPDRAPVGG